MDVMTLRLTKILPLFFIIGQIQLCVAYINDFDKLVLVFRVYKISDKFIFGLI